MATQVAKKYPSELVDLLAAIGHTRRVDVASYLKDQDVKV